MAVNANKITTDTLQEEQLLKLAHQYKYGVKREVNPRKSAAIYARLAKSGNTEAMNQLGKLYLNGDGVKKDYVKARRLFTAAVKGGSNNAKCNLALMYQKGLGIHMDNRKAFALYKSAADNGSAQGCYGAGYLMYKGRGVRQSYEDAAKYLEKGAEKGHSGCDLLLASYHANGFGTVANVEKAERHYRRASRNGNSWTVDVTKLGVMDSIQKRIERKGKWKHVKDGTLPQKGMRKHVGNAAPEEIEGKWTGKVYTYDWSRQTITAEQDMALEVENIGDSVRMSCYVSDSLYSVWTAVEQKDWYESAKVSPISSPYSWIATRTRFERKDNRLFAEMKTFDFVTSEYRRPMMAVLQKEDLQQKKQVPQTFELVSVSGSNGTLSFVIDADTDMDVNISICSAFGTDYQNIGSRSLSAGRNKFTFHALSLRNGAYAVRVSRKDESHSKKVTVRSHE